MPPGDSDIGTKDDIEDSSTEPRVIFGSKENSEEFDVANLVANEDSELGPMLYLVKFVGFHVDSGNDPLDVGYPGDGSSGGFFICPCTR